MSARIWKTPLLLIPLLLGCTAVVEEHLKELQTDPLQCTQGSLRVSKELPSPNCSVALGERVKIRFTQAVPDELLVSMYDSTGNLIFAEKTVPLEGQELTFFIPHLPVPSGSPIQVLFQDPSSSQEVGRFETRYLRLIAALSESGILTITPMGSASSDAVTMTLSLGISMSPDRDYAVQISPSGRYAVVGAVSGLRGGYYNFDPGGQTPAPLAVVSLVNGALLTLVEETAGMDRAWFSKNGWDPAQEALLVPQLVDGGVWEVASFSLLQDVARTPLSLRGESQFEAAPLFSLSDHWYAVGHLGGADKIFTGELSQGAFTAEIIAGSLSGGTPSTFSCAEITGSPDSFPLEVTLLPLDAERITLLVTCALFEPGVPFSVQTHPTLTRALYTIDESAVLSSETLPSAVYPDLFRRLEHQSWGFMARYALLDPSALTLSLPRLVSGTWEYTTITLPSALPGGNTATLHTDTLPSLLFYCPSSHIDDLSLAGYNIAVYENLASTPNAWTQDLTALVPALSGSHDELLGIVSGPQEVTLATPLFGQWQESTLLGQHMLFTAIQPAQPRDQTRSE